MNLRPLISHSLTLDYPNLLLERSLLSDLLGCINVS